MLLRNKIIFYLSNNNNNNNNDNKFNGNENDLNEGNAMSETMAMNMIMPGGRELFAVEPVMTKDDKTGNKLIHFRRKRTLSEEVDASNANLADNGKVASVIMDFINLWMKSIAANSKDCQRFHFCITNDQVGNGHELFFFEISTEHEERNMHFFFSSRKRFELALGRNFLTWNGIQISS